MAIIKKPSSQIYKIYVCSPYRPAKSKVRPSELEAYFEEINRNVENAKQYCNYIIRTSPDTLPVAPHIYLTQFLDDREEDDRNLALATDRLLVGECNQLWVFGERVSDGMAAEISEAARLGLPIRWFTTDCKERAVPETTEAAE